LNHAVIRDRAIDVQKGAAECDAENLG